MLFNPKTNRIINGVCEYCGILASQCEHYKAGAAQPLDETQKLAIREDAPVFTSAPVMPLQAEEKAATVAEAQAKMEEMTKPEKLVLTTVVEAKLPVASIEPKKKGRPRKA